MTRSVPEGDMLCDWFRQLSCKISFRVQQEHTRDKDNASDRWYRESVDLHDQLWFVAKVKRSISHIRIIKVPTFNGFIYDVQRLFMMTTVWGNGHGSLVYTFSTPVSCIDNWNGATTNTNNRRICIARCRWVKPRTSKADNSCGVVGTQMYLDITIPDRESSRCKTSDQALERWAWSNGLPAIAELWGASQVS